MSVVKDIVQNKVWESIPYSRHVISTGHKISFQGLYQTYLTLQVENITPDIVITSQNIWETMEQWGYGDCVSRQEGEKPQKIELLRESENGVGAKIWGADIYVDADMPDNILIIGSTKIGEFARLEHYKGE
jgi:hypothetical protein